MTFCKNNRRTSRDKYQRYQKTDYLNLPMKYEKDFNLKNKTVITGSMTRYFNWQFRLTIIPELCPIKERQHTMKQKLSNGPTWISYLCGFPRQVLRIHQLNLQFVALMIQISRYIGKPLLWRIIQSFYRPRQMPKLNASTFTGINLNFY